MTNNWVCTECGDVIESGCTHPPRVCENCHSILSFVEVPEAGVPLAKMRPVRVVDSEVTT